MKTEPVVDDELNDEFELSEEDMGTEMPKQEVLMAGIKAETVEKEEEIIKMPSPKMVVIDETKYAKVSIANFYTLTSWALLVALFINLIFIQISNHDKATDGKCGHCEGCVR